MKKIKSMRTNGNFEKDSYPDNTDSKLTQNSLQSGEKKTWCLCEGLEELSNTSLIYLGNQMLNKDIVL